MTTRSASRAARVPRPIFSPTPHDVVELMLNVAEVQKNDTVIDLGCGDGRIVIAAAQRRGARAIGYEIDPELVHASREAVEASSVSSLVEIRHQDMYSADLTEAQVVAVYLYPVALQKLKLQFAKMPAGSCIVSHHYKIPEAKPTRVVTLRSNETGDEHRVLLYRTPLRSNTVAD